MTFSGNFMPPRFGAGTSSNFKPRVETCSVCGNQTSRQNLIYAGTRFVGPVCAHCRSPLPKPQDGDPED